MTERAYAGGELDVFAQAEHWKRYLVSQIAPFLGPRVLEVGAGIGATTRAFCEGERGEREAWVCLDPDPQHAREIGALVEQGALPAWCTVRCGTLGDLDPSASFDAIAYLDVLEHIEDDAGETGRAALHLAPGGHLVVLSPAHPWLYSPFDAAIGHHRRYTKETLRALGPAGLELVRLRYLDSVGLLAAAANRTALRQSNPTLRQIQLWDRLLVRASVRLDPVLGYRVGKSVLGIWRRAP
jgi:SAM-dependent methyltransferase